jgi:hypothetical protein
LLLCLGLVIFSRVAGGSLDFPRVHNRSGHLSAFQVESPIDSSPDSPRYIRTGSLREGRRWLDPDPDPGSDSAEKRQRQRQFSEETAATRSRSRDISPPTPISSYSRSANPSLSPPLESTAIVLGHDGIGEHLEVPLHTNSTPRTTRTRKRRSQQTRNPTFDRSSDGLDPSTTSDLNDAPYQPPAESDGEPYPSPPPDDHLESRGNLQSTSKPLPALPVDGG